MYHEDKINFLKTLIEGVPGSKEFEDLHGGFLSIINSQAPTKFTVFTVAMSFVDSFLNQAKDTGMARAELALLTSLVQSVVDDALPPEKSHISSSAATIVSAVLGCSKNEAGDYLNSDVGVFAPVGNDHKWISGSVVAKMLALAQKKQG